ncbi:hypothetical protein BGZ67_001490, partial [Mortierella alpina]
MNMLSRTLKHTSLGRLRICQAVHSRAIHFDKVDKVDREVIVEALKERLAIRSQLENDAQRLRKRRALIKAMNVCELGCPADRALFQGLVAKYKQISQGKDDDKFDGPSGDEFIVE